MCDSLIDYTRTIRPLRLLLDKALAGKRKTKRVASRVAITFGPETVHSFEQRDAIYCLFVDASDTQVAKWKQGAPITEQAHEILICKGGSFSGAQIHWGTIDKVAFPIILSCANLDYLLLRHSGFKVYCDNRSLIHVFAPGQEVKKHIRGKLLRWAVKLMEFRYTIVHIEGTNNLWVDMITRSGGCPPAALTMTKTASFKRVTRSQVWTARQPVLRPLDQEGFTWTTLTEIAAAQTAHIASAPAAGYRDESGMIRIGGALRVPTVAKTLIQRRPVMAQCDAQGHRGENVVLSHMRCLFSIDGLTKLVRRFLRSCLLLPCDTLTSEVTVEALLGWYSRFGVPLVWVSDNGSHFKTQVMAEFCKRLKCQQQFVVAYSPWVNGSVERANRDVIQNFAQGLDYLVPLVQANLNHSPVASLANQAPVEVFMGLPCPTQAYVLCLPSQQPREVSISSVNIEQSQTQLRCSIENMLRDVVDIREKITLLNKRKYRGAEEVNFSVGDYMRGHNKLLVTWIGPYLVTRADSHTFRVRHLVTCSEQDVHASRLKFYADSDLEVTEELLEHVAAQGIIMKTQSLELLVSWYGFEYIENSWELLQSLIKDVPALVRSYVEAAKDNKLTTTFRSLVTNKSRYMEEADETMVPHSGGGMPIAVYPPLPPYPDVELHLHEMTTRTATIQGSDTKRQVEVLAHHAAVAHQETAERLGQVQRQHDHLAAQTSEYLQAQHERQTALLEQQQEMRRQMNEHRKYLEEQYRLLKAVEEAVGLQGQQAVQGHLQARWGAFAQGTAPSADRRPADESPAVTVAAGTNLPVPPIYRGSTKNEKRDFMDSYAIYARRIKALNQGTQAKFFVMPLSACIEQGAMVRICGFVLFKDEKDVTEAEWRDYFLSARIPDNAAYKTLDKEVRSLCIDNNLLDAESRLSRLMADFMR
ncbi:Hypothetical protein PHPALM_8882 [Phytophthora palmivora]|uniref:Integrase catalytic domain-containing protein n=1 Tax=Phytophthora palmivora TaxID=4796 RepID=A0A2P4Y8R7_9STRA|nr:Hypothetical protein PHPALM_8882 [Phytophthora palmivora]